MNTLELQAAFADMRAAVRDGLNEDDVERLFQPIYVALGYTNVGRDILGKRKGKSGVPDVRLANSDDSVQVIVELKKPAEELSDHEGQLIRYVRDLKAPYGLLSNGRELWLYSRSGMAVDRTAQHAVAALAEDAAALEALRKRTVEPTDFAQVKARFTEAKQEGLVLVAIGSLQSEQFLNTFALAPGRPFGDLVEATQKILDDLLQRSDFARGTYDFWKKTYARELSSQDVPGVWKPFLERTTKESIYRFTYALETSYLLAARLILAKAIQDHDRGGRISSKHIADRFISDLDTRADDRTGRLPPTAYLEVAQTLFNRYATSLFTSVYAQDLFDWWRDYARGNAANQNTFALALGRLVLSLVRFDFSKLEGDLLGELYQSYFDPETRKALGEFYTPPEVVEFILDEVGYEGEGYLLDPATGSGTFLIGALRRYLKANETRDPAETLKGLAREFKLVAFDVNPFAVLMAQVNVAALLVPLYARAVEADAGFTLRRLPIVRTDSLRQEVVEGERRQQNTQFGLDFGEETIRATIPLPVKVGKEFLEVTLEFPRLEAARTAGLIRNVREWLLALQSVFIAVEERSQAFDRHAPLPDIAPSLRAELALYWREPDALTRYLEPYAEKVWAVLEILKTKHGDGRFLKTLEDLMLGLVLKHYLEYDFVVGNPPYVRIQNIPEVLKKYWEGKYVWATGSYDIFIPFIERALYGDRPWLKNGGKLGYIVPNRFLNANYAGALRANLPKSARIQSITDFKAVTFNPPEEDQASRLFKEAMVYPAMLIAQKGSPLGETYAFRAARFYPKTAPLHPAEAIEALREAYREIPPAPLVKGGSERDGGRMALCAKKAEYADVFTQSSDVLEPDGWHLMPELEREVFDKLEAVGSSRDPSLPVTKKATSQQRRLENYTATESGGFAGVQTSLDSLMVLKQLDENESEGLLYVEPRGGGSPFWVEKEPLRPFLFGKDVERWHVGWEGWWVIFPYFRHNGRYLFMPSTDYWDFRLTRGNQSYRVFEGHPKESVLTDEKYPKLWAYLKQHEKAFRGREGGRFNIGKREEWKWYDLAYPRSLEVFEKNKVVLQVTTKSSNLAFDKSSHFFTAGGTSGVYGLLPNEHLKVEVLASLLNAATGEFYVKHLSSSFGSGYYSYGDQFIKNLPIPETTPGQQQTIAAFAQTLTDKTARLRELEKDVETFPASVTSQRRADARVPDLDDLERLVSANNLAQTVDAGKVSEQSTLQGETVLSIGKGELRAKPALVRFVRRVLRLRGKMSTEDLLALEMPMNPADQTAYLETLAAWEKEAARLHTEIAGLEAELNSAVYEAYGLDADDRRVVEAFLERF